MAKAKGRGEGKRRLGVKVRSARGRTTSSTRWLQRQLNDPYVARAKEDGYRSRAAYKLLEIDEKYALLKPGMKVIDLGAAPGGWSQIAVKKVRAADGAGQVIAADLSQMGMIPDVTILLLDFTEAAAPNKIRAELKGKQADLVMSDMAAPSTGHRQTDHLRIIGLCEVALDFAEEILAPEGTFLAKVLQGGTEKDLLDRLKKNFTSVRHVKPAASRADSAELYVLAQGYRGADIERNVT